MTGPGHGKQEALKIFSGLSSAYDSVLDYCTFLQDRRWKDWAARHLALTKGLKVLDIGIGTSLLEERLRRDCFLVGLDVSGKMLKISQATRPKAAVSLLLSDGEKLPFKDASFHAVVSCYVVKYCEPGILMAEIARVLRPGGRLVLYDFVRPRGSLWPLNAVYTYGGLPLLAKVMRMKGSSITYTFEALPRVIAGSHWEETLGEDLAESGFSSVERTLLSGGAAMGFVAMRNCGSV